VRDLVGPGVHELPRIHAGRHVTGDREPEVVRLARDHGHERGRYALVDLDLPEARRRVAPHHRARLVRSAGGDDPKRAPERVGAPVDDPGQEQARAEQPAARERVAHRRGERELVAHVARGGHAGGEANERPLRLFVVHVHVPQPRQHRAPRDVEAWEAGGHGNARRRTDRCDAPVADEDRRALERWRTGAVDHARVHDRPAPRVHRGDGARHRSLLADPLGDGRAHDVREDRLVPFAHRLHAVELRVTLRGGDEARVRVEPRHLRPPRDPVHEVAVEDHATAADAQRVDAAADEARRSLRSERHHVGPPEPAPVPKERLLDGEGGVRRERKRPTGRRLDARPAPTSWST
jgi:hypothetical protein